MLNPDGTVNLDAAERALALAEAACSKAYADCRRAERAVYSTRPWLIEHGRAIQRLEVARSNSEGAFEMVLRARCAVDEALNPELA